MNIILFQDLLHTLNVVIIDSDNFTANLGCKLRIRLDVLSTPGSFLSHK
jgi:hypothetical protein